MNQDIEISHAIQETYDDGFKEGLKEGVKRFAWWKDGVEYVGTCGTTLKDALKEIDEEVKE